MKFKRTLASIFSCIMLASCVAVLTSSCGDEGGSGGTGGTGGGEEEPVTIIDIRIGVALIQKQTG